MKKIASVLVLVFCSAAWLHAQSSGSAYYVVVGAFAKLENAVRFTDKANKNNFTAAYALQPTRKLYYVYVLSTPDKKKAYAFLIKTRAESAYKECWVYNGELGEVTSKPVAEKPVEKPVEKPIEKPVETAIEPIISPKKDSVPVVVVEKPKVDSVAVAKPVVKKPEGKAFLFKLVNRETGNEVMGEVHLQENTRSPQYQSFRGNEIAYVKAPVNREGTYIVTTNAPGYQQVKTTVVYGNPGVTTGPEGEYIIPMELQHAKSGDYIDFNNVHFIRNSSVMTPDSQNELDGLVSLMKENTKYKIKIHGHCNGRATRELILRGSSTKFFAMDPSANKKTTASDKVLSEDRANSVKAYLESQGIEGSRITTKGEGGKIPLYPEGSTLASYNDRVEVEVKGH